MLNQHKKPFVRSNDKRVERVAKEKTIKRVEHYKNILSEKFMLVKPWYIPKFVWYKVVFDVLRVSKEN